MPAGLSWHLYLAKKPVPQGIICLEDAGEAGCDHRYICLFHATCCHALMLGINQNRHPFGRKRILDGLRDLRCHGFLCLQAAGKAVQHPRQLGNANHPPVWQIGNVGNPRIGTI